MVFAKLSPFLSIFNKHQDKLPTTDTHKSVCVCLLHNEVQKPLAHVE